MNVIVCLEFTHYNIGVEHINYSATGTFPECDCTLDNKPVVGCLVGFMACQPLFYDKVSLTIIVLLV